MLPYATATKHTLACHTVDSSRPAADFGLFTIVFATALAYEEQPGHCLFQSKQGEAISAEVSG